MQQSVTLAVINVEFTNLTFLIWMAWTIFFWCMYRYWLEYRGHFKDRIVREMIGLRNSKILRLYIEHKSNIEIVPHSKEGYVVHTIDRYPGNWRANILEQVFSPPLEDDDPYSTRWEKVDGSEETIIIDGFVGKMVIAAMAIGCAYKQPSFSSLAVPPLLWLAGLLGGLYRIGQAYFF